MRYSKQHKAETRRKILASAVDLFAANGYAATSIDEVMGRCGLTRGGFYAHFRSKAHLYSDAIAHASMRQQELSSENDWLDALIAEFIETAPHTTPSSAARLAFFATDVSSGQPDVRGAYMRAFRALSSEISKLGQGHGVPDQKWVLSLTAMILGAAAIARTTDDAELLSELSSSCRDSARALLEHSDRLAPTFFWTPMKEAEVPRDAPG